MVAVAAATLLVALAPGAARAADAGFSWSPTSPQPGAPVSFTADQQPSPSPVMATTWAWDFESDGTVDSTGPNPQHAFPSAGTWNVTLTVSDSAGPATQARQVVVAPAPTAPESSFTATPTTGTAPLTVAFADTSANAPTAWSWSFGDGEGSAAQHPTHTFARPGTYTVTLTASNAVGSDVTPAVAAVTVSAAGVAGATPTPSPVVPASSPLAPASSPLAPAGLMRPFPTVRLRGTVGVGWSRIDLLQVRAPRGARVRVRCQGTGCPYATRSTGPLIRTRTVRFSSMERRLRAGAVVRVEVTASPSRRLIGKYASFMIRRGAAPVRRDRCIAPGARRPSPCPPAQSSTSDRLLEPFPVVRMRGVATRGSWSHISSLTVRAPANALVRVRCAGSRCPYGAKQVALGRARTVRFRALERNLRAGTVIRIWVTSRGPDPRIGKFVRFVMRRGASPRRQDRCLAPGSTTPMRCPG